MFISRFSILFHHFICNPYASITYVYTLMPLSHSFTYCRFVISLEMEKNKTWVFMILLSSFKIILAIQGPMQFRRNWRIGFFIFGGEKKGYWTFDKDSIKPVRLTIPTQEYKPYFRIFRSLISFSNVLLFSVYKSFTSLM